MSAPRHTPVRARGNCAAWLLPVCLACMGTLPQAVQVLAPKQGSPVAAVFPPWWSQTQTATAGAGAGGAILRFGAWPTIVVLQPLQRGLAARLLAAGAWLVLSASLPAPCGASVHTQTRT